MLANSERGTALASFVTTDVSEPGFPERYRETVNYNVQRRLTRGACEDGPLSVTIERNACA